MQAAAAAAKWMRHWLLSNAGDEMKGGRGDDDSILNRIAVLY
jgi:hypothetical protein